MDFTRKKCLLDFCLGGEILSIRDWSVERLSGEGGGQVGRVGGEQDQGEKVEDPDQEPDQIGLNGLDCLTCQRGRQDRSQCPAA